MAPASLADRPYPPPDGMHSTHSDHPVTDARLAVSLPTSGEGVALFLDVDGTLLEIAGSPDEVRVESRLHDVLIRLRRRLDGAVALVSGRRIGDLDRLFSLDGMPAAGLHGLERRRGDGHVIGGTTQGLPVTVKRPLQAFALAHPGVLIEDKGVALALHYRGAPAAEAAARAVVAALMAEHAGEFAVLDGKMVLEVRRGGSHKGDAIVAFMSEAPFKGRRALFIGDDVTDEDGFEAVNRLNGWSVRVGDDRPTQARFRLADVTAVIDWLDELSSTGDGGVGESRAGG